MLLRLALFVGLAFFLAACGGGGDDNGAVPTSGAGTPDAGITPGLGRPEDIATLLATALGTQPPLPTRTPGEPKPPDVAAREDLAGRFDRSVEDIDVLSVTTMEWPDSCLGLGEQNEVCLEVITPGFEVVLRLGESQYTYRTNEAGTAVRLADVDIIVD